MKNLFTRALARVRARWADLCREARIDRLARQALLAKQHGYPRAELLLAREMYDEMNLRSPEQRARLAKAAQRRLTARKARAPL